MDFLNSLPDTFAPQRSVRRRIGHRAVVEGSSCFRPLGEELFNPAKLNVGRTAEDVKITVGKSLYNVAQFGPLSVGDNGFGPGVRFLRLGRVIS
ncbi:hypothetical protein [Nitrosomonas sp. ANs5]|uniref:hypothetical protein n=1 Tax=Nitrosomonas sp. ANs5 TaxID=3423941 RepID=UPI003D34C520